MPEVFTISRPLPPEDVRPGDYVAVLRESHEFINIFALCDPLLGRETTVRVTLTPDEAGVPLRVVAVCLPFVLVEDGGEKHRTLDLRRHAIARLDEDYARKAMKRLRRDRGGCADA